MLLMGKWKAAAVIGLFVLGFDCYFELGPRQELVPVTMVWAGVTHLVLRGPYRPLTLWELPAVALSLALAGLGGWSFLPDEPGFRLFFAAFVTLALSYGFACTASAPNTRWRREVLEPTRRFSHFSLPLLDIGLTLAPFLFPLLALRYLLRPK